MREGLQERESIEREVMEPNATSPPISATQAFDCSTDEFWTLISAPGNLNDAHPFCERNEPLVWDGETHRDRLVYLNGRTYVREFQTWNPGEGYTLLIGEEDGPQSYVVWTIEATSAGGSQLTITVHPYLLANLPRRGGLPALPVVDSSQTAALFAQRRRWICSPGLHRQSRTTQPLRAPFVVFVIIRTCAASAASPCRRTAPARQRSRC